MTTDTTRRDFFKALLRQPSGFEGGLEIRTPLEANYLAVAKRPSVRLILDLAVAGAASVAADGSDDRVATVKELTKLMAI